MRTLYIVGIVCAYLPAGCTGKTPSHDNDHKEHAEAAAGEIVFSEDKAASVGLSTKVIEPDAFTEVIKTGGSILAAPGDEQTIVATTPGVVSFLPQANFAEGAAVRKGQTLLALLSGNLMEGDVAVRVRAAYEKAKSEYERAKSLAKEKIVSEKEYNQALSDYETAKASYDAIAGKTSLSGGISVSAPLNGYLKNIQVKEGDYVETGQPLATVSQNRRLVLRADVPGKYYNQLALVRSAHFKTPYDDCVYKLSDLNGRLLSYAKSSGGNSFYIPVTFEFDNKGAVVPGTFVEVYLLTSSIPNALHVPVSSLIEEQGVYSVFLQMDGDCYKKQEVKLGANNGDEVQILAGIKAGDAVVTQAAYHLKLATAANRMPAHHH